MLGYLNKKLRQKELSKWGFVCECDSCTSEQDDDLLTDNAKLEADIRHQVTRSGTNKDWAMIAGWQHQVMIS